MLLWSISWLDAWHGILSLLDIDQTFQTPSKVSNLVLIDKGGVIRYSETGREVDKENLNRLFEAIEGALERGR